MLKVLNDFSDLVGKTIIYSEEHYRHVICTDDGCIMCFNVEDSWGVPTIEFGENLTKIYENDIKPNDKLGQLLHDRGFVTDQDIDRWEDEIEQRTKRNNKANQERQRKEYERLKKIFEP